METHIKICPAAAFGQSAAADLQYCGRRHCGKISWSGCTCKRGGFQQRPVSGTGFLYRSMLWLWHPHCPALWCRGLLSDAESDFPKCCLHYCTCHSLNRSLFRILSADSSSALHSGQYFQGCLCISFSYFSWHSLQSDLQFAGRYIESCGRQ